jgi:hypothetical protein
MRRGSRSVPNSASVADGTSACSGASQAVQTAHPVPTTRIVAVTTTPRIVVRRAAGVGPAPSGSPASPAAAHPGVGRTPSGVISNAHASTSATGKPKRMKTTSIRCAHSGKRSASKTYAAAWTRTNPTAAYVAATRKTRRRFSSANRWRSDHPSRAMAALRCEGDPGRRQACQLAAGQHVRQGFPNRRPEDFPDPAAPLGPSAADVSAARRGARPRPSLQIRSVGSLRPDGTPVCREREKPPVGPVPRSSERMISVRCRHVLPLAALGVR